MPLNPIDYLKSLLNPNPAQGGGEDIDLPAENFVGPREPKPEVSPWQKAATIGASQVGERYAEPTNPTTLDLIRRFTAGAERPRSVAAQDPYGIEAWKKDAGPAPGLMMGSTEEVGGEALKKAVAGLKGFYSRVDKTAEDLPSAMHPSKAEGIFKNNAAKEEVDYRGLSDFLKNNQGPKVTKAEIQDHLAAHPMPEIGVKDLGGPKPTGHLDDGAGGIIPYHDNPATGEPYYFSPTKYDRPSLNVPGGENYRERLLTLPSPDDNLSSIDTGTKEFAQWHYNHYGAYPLEADLTDPGTIRAYMANKGIGDNGVKEFQSSHWDEPNVLAHSRFDERTLDPSTQVKRNLTVEPNTDHDLSSATPSFNYPYVVKEDGEPIFWAYNEEGAHRYLTHDPFEGEKTGVARDPQWALKDQPGTQKGRFLQEVQSDWHQLGKERGYSTGDEFAAHQARLKEIQQQHQDLVRQIMPLQHEESYLMQTGEGGSARRQELARMLGPMEEQVDTLQAEISRMSQSRVDQGIPDAPFKESWPDLVLKQHVMDVAEKPDLNWLGFTTGETQNQRYDLSQHIKELRYDPYSKRLIGINQAGDIPLDTVVEPDEMAAHIGQEPTQRLLATPQQNGLHILAGQDLQTGGAGMKHFYDKKLPSALAKILKPFGGKVELGEIPGPAKSKYSYLADPEHNPDAIKSGGDWVTNIYRTPKSEFGDIAGLDQYEHVASSWPPALSEAAARHGARDLVQLVRNSQPKELTKFPAWIAHLPPEMKKAIMEKGLPLLTLLGMSQMNPSDQSQASPDAMQGLKNAR